MGSGGYQQFQQRMKAGAQAAANTRPSTPRPAGPNQFGVRPSAAQQRRERQQPDEQGHKNCERRQIHAMVAQTIAFKLGSPTHNQRGNNMPTTRSEPTTCVRCHKAISTDDFFWEVRMPGQSQPINLLKDPAAPVLCGDCHEDNAMRGQAFRNAHDGHVSSHTNPASFDARTAKNILSKWASTRKKQLNARPLTRLPNS
jgi:hypothetical protein